VRVIVGIGNPGNRYAFNRHNIGFQFLDYYAQKKSLRFSASKSNFYFAEGEIDNNPFLLVKPVTFVNNSGEAVLNVIQNYNISVDDLLIVVDDLNIPFASIRIRKSGGDGGHNGLSSIIYHLQSDDFPRLRIGIGTENLSVSLPEFVLSDFTENEFLQLRKVFDNCLLLVDDFIKGGFIKMLNSYSRLKKIEN
jgi:PTH1 family peptidyl-tRNA hydrolase